MKMKMWALVLIVVLLHCSAVCALLVLQGCGTARGPEQPPAVVMPPLPPPERVTISPAEYPVEAVKEKVCTVKPGDSISRIAQRYGTSQAEIVALNKLTDPNKLRVGQTLLLPAYVKLDKPAVQKAPARAPAADSGNTYVVQAGDSISKIARHLGVSEDDLVMVNNLADRNKVRIGQKLVVPAGAQKPASVVSVEGEDTAAPVAGSISSESLAAKEEAAAPAVPAAPAVVVHVVEPGQDLRSIAPMYGATVDELMELNGLSSEDKLEAGMRLKVPLQPR